LFHLQVFFFLHLYLLPIIVIYNFDVIYSVLIVLSFLFV
jgi:hypothetical protein